MTVSVAGMTPVRDLRALVAALPARARPDFFDAHHFTGGGELAEQVFSTLRDVAAPTPLWIGELGYPTSTTHSGFAGVPLTPSGQEAAQAHYFKLCFSALARLGLPAPGIWILDDFAPDAIPQSDLSGQEPEYHFGLFHEDGSAKPAAAAVRRLFAGRLETGFNGGFEAAAAAEDGTSGARGLGLDRRAAARSRHDASHDPAPLRLESSAAQAEVGPSWSPRSRLRSRTGARSYRRGFAARKRRFASRSSGSTPRAAR